MTPPAMSTNHHSLSVYHWYNADRGAAERHVSDAVAVLGSEHDARDRGQLSQLGHALAMQAHLALHDSDVTGAQLLVTHAREPRRAPTTRRSSCAPG